MGLIYISGVDIEVLKTIIEILALLVGANILVFVFFQFHPIMTLCILTEWIDNEKIVLVKIVIKNIFKVRCKKVKVLMQFLEYPINFNKELSEWVPFDKTDIRIDEQPINYKKPTEIFSTTEYWYSGAIAEVERAYRCEPGKIYKIGLQLTAKISFLGRISKLFKRGQWKLYEQWTTTKIIYCN